MPKKNTRCVRVRRVHAVAEDATGVLRVKTYRASSLWGGSTRTSSSFSDETATGRHESSSALIPIAQSLQIPCVISLGQFPGPLPCSG